MMGRLGVHQLTCGADSRWSHIFTVVSTCVCDTVEPIEGAPLARAGWRTGPEPASWEWAKEE